ncbi:MAG: hypothetical protein ACRDRJ_02015 [Streptosporangiaceae bacterium]
MSNFLGAIPALIGVVVGIVATSWAERARWKRGQTIRWDERRVDAYAEYARAVKRIHITALRIVRPDRAENLTSAIDRQAALEILTQAEAQRTEAWELILLLADKATAHAALRWHTVVRREAEFARSHPGDAESNDWVVLVRSVDRARDLFYEAARNSVDVGGGSVEMTELLRSVSPTRADSERPTDL